MPAMTAMKGRWALSDDLVGSFAINENRKERAERFNWFAFIPRMQ